MTVKRTTNEWTEDFFPVFAKDVDIHISMFTDLKGQEAYTLRRMIMISLRGGPSDLQRLTDKMETAYSTGQREAYVRMEAVLLENHFYSRGEMIRLCATEIKRLK